MENNIWIQDGNIFTKGSSTMITHADGLPIGIYEVDKSLEGWYLRNIANKFVFDYKIYGVNDKFINYCIKTYNNTTGNLGILFNGIKGTGKTLSAKVLCNKLNLPVIIVKSYNKDSSEMLNFLATQVDFECIFFFDEYEKEFEDSSDVLSFMDGVHNSETRKIFLLTTNNTDNINDNLLGRPSRIRYVHTFDNLSEEVIIEILNDVLIDKNAIEPIIDLLHQIQIVTIDLVKALAQEINIHGVENLAMIKQNFNIEFSRINYLTDVIQVKPEFWTTHKANTKSYKLIIDTYDIVSKLNNRKSLTEQEKEACQFRDNYFYSDSKIVDEDKKLNYFKIGDTFNGYNIMYVSVENKYVVVLSYDYITIYIIKNAYATNGARHLNQII